VRQGNLGRLITIQRKVVTPSSSGEPTETWSDIGHQVHSSYRPLRGDERFTTAQEVANEEVEFIARHSTALEGLSPLDRIVYPAPSAEDVQSPDAGSVYDILAAHELDRRRGIRIASRRRADI
jgi:head-tail adaptor